jgi:leucyl aminopeptidase (aminopeptidase T)
MGEVLPLDEDDTDAEISDFGASVDEVASEEPSGINEVGEAEEELDPLDIMSQKERDEALNASAEMVVKTCMEIYRHENVLIVSDPSTSIIGEALYLAASEISERVLMVVMPKSRHHGEEPPRPVADLMRQQDVILAPTRYSLTHTRARLAATRQKARITTMPGMNVEMFTEGGMTADFASIKSEIAEVYGTLRRKKTIHITTPGGTDVTFDVNWRDWNLDDSGICNRPGMVTNLPAGKIFITPKEGSMEGIVVVDGAWDADLLDEPITMNIEKGSVIDVTGGPEAAHLRQTFRDAAAKMKPRERESIWGVAEFGFGMNPKARLRGNSLEDEKVLGTCYFTIGTLSGAGLRLVGVVNQASIVLDGDELKFSSGEK